MQPGCYSVEKLVFRQSYSDYKRNAAFRQPPGAEQEGISETLLFYQAVNPAVESVILPESRHLPQLEAPEALLEQLKIFL